MEKIVSADVVPDIPLSNENELHNSTSDHMNFAWPSIIFHNTLTQMRDAIFLLVMVFLD